MVRSHDEERETVIGEQRAGFHCSGDCLIPLQIESYRRQRFLAAMTRAYFDTGVVPDASSVRDARGEHARRLTWLIPQSRQYSLQGTEL